MQFESVASAARGQGLRLWLKQNAPRSSAFVAALSAAALCSLASGVSAQVQFPGLVKGDAVCLDDNNNLVTKRIAGVPTCSGTVTGTSNGNIHGVNDLSAVNVTASGTVTAGTGSIGTLFTSNANLGTGAGNTVTTIGADGADLLTVNAATNFTFPVDAELVRSKTILSGNISTKTLSSDDIFSFNISTNTITTKGKATLSSLEVTNDAVVKGDLTVNGNFELNGTLALNGSLDMKGNNITGVGTLGVDFISAGAISTSLLAVSGNTILGNSPADSLTVNATSTFNAPVTINSTLTTTGNVTVGGFLDVKQNAKIAGELDVGGNLNVGSLLSANVTTNVVAINGTLDMTGGNITNVGAITAATGSFGSITTSGLAVSGDTFLGNSPADKLIVNGTSTFNAPATMTKGATVSESFTVTPGSTISMGGNRVQDVGTPILDTDAANKGYVDAGLAKAFKEIDRNTQGIAIAMAMTGLALPADKNFALGANLGFFEDKQGVAVQGAIRVNSFVTVTGAFGTGVQDLNTVGGRVGLQVAW